MENEENRGLINKNDFEDQWARLGQFSFELSHYSLSLSHTLGHLEFSWITSALEKERQEEARIK